MPFRAVLGLVLIAAGALIIAGRLNIIHFHWDDFWPLILVFIGVIIILRGMQARSGAHIIHDKKESEQ